MFSPSKRYAILQAMGVDVYVSRQRKSIGSLSTDHTSTLSPRLVIVSEIPLSTTQPLVADMVRSLPLPIDDIKWIHVDEGVWPLLPEAPTWLALGESLGELLKEKLSQTKDRPLILVTKEIEKKYFSISRKKELWQYLKILIKQLYR